MRNKSAKSEEVIARIAAHQHGVISAGQLRDAGLARDVISRRAQVGRLHRVHRGVYAVGYPGLSAERRWMAAVLACGEKAVLSHRSAAALWGLLGDAKGHSDVSVPTTGGRRQRSGIRIHRRLSLSPSEVTRRRNIPVTKPARTIADLRGAVSPAEHRRAVRQAEVFGYPTGLDPSEPTRSELEDLFLRLCRRHQLPAPEVNVRVAGHEVDFLWRDHKLVVEADGYRYHRGHIAFEEDHQRDLDLRANSYAVQRYTYQQVTSEPKRVTTSIAEALAPNPR